MSGVRVVDGRGAGPLDALTRQLWAPTIDDGDARVVVGGAAHEPGWRTVEDYWAVPDAARARLLVPAGSRRLTARALTAYQGLRPGRLRALRRALAVGARLGVPPGRDRVRLQVREGSSAVGPVARAGQALGLGQAHAAVGVRLGANAKPTLQVLDDRGVPVGFVKMAWEVQSAGFVTAEDAVLTAVGGLLGSVRVPRVVARGSHGGFPYLVTEPLPPDSHRPRAEEAPTPGELLALAPAVGTRTPGSTAHLRALAVRLRVLEPWPEDDALLAAALELLTRVEEVTDAVPVVERWHGDLVPWNAARDGRGVLWVWDWETAESEAVAGLDAIHWTMNSPDRPAPGQVPVAFDARRQAARAVLAGMGLDRRAQDVALGLYGLALAERGLSLARARGSWSHVLVGPEPLGRLVGSAHRVICPGG